MLKQNLRDEPQHKKTSTEDSNRPKSPEEPKHKMKRIHLINLGKLAKIVGPYDLACAFIEQSHWDGPSNRGALRDIYEIEAQPFKNIYKCTHIPTFINGGKSLFKTISGWLG